VSPPLPALLALLAPQARQIDYARFYTFMGIIVALSLLAGLAVLAFRRRLLRRDSDPALHARLMDDLRAMRDRGEISPDEYDSARATMAARLAGRPPPPKPPPAPRSHSDSTRRAPPGFDLTGAPLPSPPRPPNAK
jgi:hypothetical protein